MREKIELKNETLNRFANISTCLAMLKNDSIFFDKLVELFQNLGWLYANLPDIRRFQPCGWEILGIESKRRKISKNKKKDFIEAINQIAQIQSWNAKKSRKNLMITEDSIMFGRKHGQYKKTSISNIKKLDEFLQEEYKDIIIDFIQRYCKKLDASWIRP